MKSIVPNCRFSALLLGAISLLSQAQPVLAHCDALDGPVVKAAQKALSETNVNLVLIWIQKGHEAEIQSAFNRTLEVRKLNSAARELADNYFFETLVRVHRAGEGAAYTGLKPAGQGITPGIAAADKAVDSGDIKPLAGMISANITGQLHHHFDALKQRAKYARDDVEAGRAFVKAYVAYIHYVEQIFTHGAQTNTHDNQAAHAASSGHNH